MPAILLLALLAHPPASHELYRAQMAAAAGALRLSEHAEARIWLDATPPGERGFEWRVHDAAADESLSTWTIGDGAPTALDVSPDGGRLAIGTDAGWLVLLDAVTGHAIARAAAHSEAVTDVKFDAKGRLATSSFDRKVKLWDAATLALALEFSGHEFPVGGVVFGPDSSWVASSSYERPPGTVKGIVHVWSATDGTLMRTLEGGRKPLVDLALSHDGRRLAAASWDFGAFAWPVEGGEPAAMMFPEEDVYNAVDGVAWSPDNRLLAACGKDKTARVFDAGGGALVATLRGHVDHVAKLRFSPGGSVLATASADGTARLWNTADFSLRAILRGHADDVAEVAFSPDGARAYTASSDGTVRIWDARTTRYGGARFDATAAAYVARFSRDGATLAVATSDGRVEIRDVRTGARLASWQAHEEGKSCHALDFTHDGRQVFTGSHDVTVRLFDVATQAELAVLPHEDSITWLRVSPDGRLLATCSGSTITITDVATLQRLHVFRGHAKAVLAVSFSPDSTWCVSSGRDGKALTWKARTGEPGVTIETKSEDVAETIFTPDGRRLVVIGRDGRVSLHSARTGRLIRELLAGRHGVTRAALSPDGTRLALGSDIVRIVDVEHGGEVGELRPHGHAAYDVDFDPAGERLVSCSTDGSVAVADAVPLRERLGEPAGRDPR